MSSDCLRKRQFLLYMFDHSYLMCSKRSSSFRGCLLNWLIEAIDRQCVFDIFLLLFFLSYNEMIVALRREEGRGIDRVSVCHHHVGVRGNNF